MVRAPFMGRVTCDATVENGEDWLKARRGEIPPDQVRTLRISDALVDTGATTLALPTSMVRQLGLTTPLKTRTVRTANGSRQVTMYGPVRLTILGRDFTLDVNELDDDCPVLIGQVPLEYLQLVVDMPNHKLIPSPANGGDWVMDLF